MGLLALERSAGEVQGRRWRTDPAKRLTDAIDELHKEARRLIVLLQGIVQQRLHDPNGSNCDLGLGEERGALKRALDLRTCFSP